ncbi:MAG TPA: alpha/beta hydrolase-fold protein, partial [Polyangiaceae bacterium]
RSGHLGNRTPGTLKRTLPSAVTRTGAAVLAGAAALSGLAVARAGPSPRQQDSELQSQAIAGSLHFVAYLPNGYDQGTTRYPVVYLLHGLPATGTGYRGVGFVEQALDATGSPAILVAPQGSTDSKTDPEYLDQGPGNRWDTAITRELVRVVDARFRTIRSRAGRALVGVSAGGYGAMHLALSHLDQFAAVESWSGYFHPTDPTGTKPLDLGSKLANARADVHRQLQVDRTRLKALPTFIAFYVGRDDTRFVAENRQLNLELSRAGIPHVFRVYAGGHDQSLWQRYAAPWLTLALNHLAPASG